MEDSTKKQRKSHKRERSPCRDDAQKGQRKNNKYKKRGGANRYSQSESDAEASRSSIESATSDYYDSESDTEMTEERPKAKDHPQLARSRRYEHRNK